MNKFNNLLFKCLFVIAWIIFIGLMINVGAVIVNFLFSIFKPDFVGRLYQKLDLIYLKEQSELGFYAIYSFIVIISVLKAHLFYLVIELMHKLDLNKPFNMFVSNQISKISYFTFSIGMLSYMAQETVQGLHRKGIPIGDLNVFWTDSQAFVLMAAVIYIIAVIFKRGIDLQRENDLTV